MVKVLTEDDLRDAIKRRDDTIEIEGNLATRVIRIKATGRVAWAVAIGAIGLGFIALVATRATGRVSTPVAGITAAGFAAPVAAASLGTEGAAAALSLAVVSGGVGVLTSLYSHYRITEKGQNRVVLVRK